MVYKSVTRVLTSISEVIALLIAGRGRFFRILLNFSRSQRMCLSMSSCFRDSHPCHALVTTKPKGFQEGYRGSRYPGIQSNWIPRFWEVLFSWILLWRSSLNARSLGEPRKPQPSTIHKLVPWGCTKLSSCNVLEGRFGLCFAGVGCLGEETTWLHVWIFEYAQGDIVTVRIKNITTTFQGLLRQDRHWETESDQILAEGMLRCRRLSCGCFNWFGMFLQRQWFSLQSFLGFLNRNTSS